MLITRATADEEAKKKQEGHTVSCNPSGLK